MFGKHQQVQATVLDAQDAHGKREYVLEVYPPTGPAFRATASSHLQIGPSPHVGEMVTVKYDPKSLKVELDLNDDPRYGEKGLKHKEQVKRQAAQVRRDALLKAPPGTPHKTKEQ